MKLEDALKMVQAKLRVSIKEKSRLECLVTRAPFSKGKDKILNYHSVSNLKRNQNRIAETAYNSWKMHLDGLRTETCNKALRKRIRVQANKIQKLNTQKKRLYNRIQTESIKAQAAKESAENRKIPEPGSEDISKKMSKMAETLKKISQAGLQEDAAYGSSASYGFVKQKQPSYEYQQVYKVIDE